jgi:uncharacterized membrane protein YqgA involved in biofilm formation
MTTLGSIQDGLSGDYTLLATIGLNLHSLTSLHVANFLLALVLALLVVAWLQLFGS